jgi:hypothetical protein
MSHASGRLMSHAVYFRGKRYTHRMRTLSLAFFRTALGVRYALKFLAVGNFFDVFHGVGQVLCGGVRVQPPWRCNAFETYQTYGPWYVGYVP